MTKGGGVVVVVVVGGPSYPNYYDKGVCVCVGGHIPRSHITAEGHSSRCFHIATPHVFCIWEKM